MIKLPLSYIEGKCPYADVVYIGLKVVNFICIEAVILVCLIRSHFLKFKVWPQSKDLGAYLIDIALDTVIISDIK